MKVPIRDSKHSKIQHKPPHHPNKVANIQPTAPAHNHHSDKRSYNRVLILLRTRLLSQHATVTWSVTRSAYESAWETHAARPASCGGCRKAAFSRSDEDRGQEEHTGVGRVGMPRDGDRVEAQDAEQWADEKHHEQAPRDRPRGTGDEKD